MAKYVNTNAEGLVTLKYQREQYAFLQALRERFCLCGATWKIEFGQPDTRLCPKCGVIGKRCYDKMLLLAGRQSGKTRIGTLGAVLEASMPYSYGWVTAPTYRDLLDFVEPAFFAQLPQRWLDEGDWNVSDRLLVLPNKARIAFRSLEDPQSARGPTLDWWLMDEACKVSGVAHEVGDAMLAIKQGVEILTTTPMGEDWVYENVWLMAENGYPGYWAAKWKSIDNPMMSREYIENKRATMSAEMFAQEYEASIVNFQGAIYGNLIEQNVIDDTTEAGYEELKKWIPEWPEINRSRPCVVGLDPGSDHPFAGVFIVVTERGLVIFNEYEQREKPMMLHAQSLRALASGLQPVWGYDRSQPQAQIELAQHGIFATPAENAVVMGIERVKSWLVTGRLKFIKSRTKKLVACCKSYRWAETEKKDGSTGLQQPFKRKDDLPDGLRYGVMTWPQLPDAPEASTGRDLSNFDPKTRRDIERMAKFERVQEEKIAEGVGEFHTPTYSEEYAVADSFWG